MLKQKQRANSKNKKTTNVTNGAKNKTKNATKQTPIIKYTRTSKQKNVHKKNKNQKR